MPEREDLSVIDTPLGAGRVADGAMIFLWAEGPGDDCWELWGFIPSSNIRPGTNIDELADLVVQWNATVASTKHSFLLFNQGVMKEYTVDHTPRAASAI